MSGSVSFHLQPGGCLKGRVRVPGDKSISHRAVMLGAIAEGVTEVSGFLNGADCLATMAAFRAMGVDIKNPAPTVLQIHGVGKHGLHAAASALELGNSGTSMRLMAGLLSGQSFTTILSGDASLSKRPMGRIVDPLLQMGAAIAASPAGTAPLTINPAKALTGIDYPMPVSSAQVKSCLLLAGLYAQGKVAIHDPGISRDHTERMLTAFGVELESQGEHVAMRGDQRLQAAPVQVPGDISSAAFLMVGAAIAPGSDLWLEAVGVNPTRDGIIAILQKMGAAIQLHARRELGGEPVADIHVRGIDKLQGIEIGRDLVTLAIDEMPAVFIAAACADGATRVTGAAELRVKESDRIATMCTGLRSLGIDAQEQPDGAIITGGNLHGGCIEAFSDHRIAMAFSAAALHASAPIRINDCDNVATSFPGFVEMLSECGLDIQKQGVARG